MRKINLLRRKQRTGPSAFERFRTYVEAGKLLKWIVTGLSMLIGTMAYKGYTMQEKIQHLEHKIISKVVESDPVKPVKPKIIYIPAKPTKPQIVIQKPDPAEIDRIVKSYMDQYNETHIESYMKKYNIKHGITR